MRLINNTNNTCKALTVRKENSLMVVQNVTMTVVRISSKAIFACIALTLLNFVV